MRFSILLICTIIAASVWGRTIQGEVRSDNDSTVVAGALCRLMAGSQVLNGVTTEQTLDIRGELDVYVRQERHKISLLGLLERESLFQGEIY